jgi:uncharacterized membrane protein YbaN (DUF454 family)
MYSKFYTEQRVRSFRRRKHISNESRFQAILAAIVATLAILVGCQYIAAQRDLTAAQVEYTNVTEVSR